MNCDFCGNETTKEDLTVLPVDRFNIPPLGYWNFSWGWGACTDCAPFLRESDWLGLLDRATTHHPEGERMRPLLAYVYLGLVQHANGPLRGWSPEDESKDET